MIPTALGIVMGIVFLIGLITLVIIAFCGNKPPD